MLNPLFKAFLLAGGVLFACIVKAQELYVFTEPASNIPSRSINAKLTGKWARSGAEGNWVQRQSLALAAGLGKNWMVQGGLSFSDMYQPAYRFESAKLYGKFRFFSADELHAHFRMAAFATLAYSRNPLVYQELALDGDQPGYQAGLVLTQLLHRTAFSFTGSYLQALTEGPDEGGEHSRQALLYSLSAGQLLLPMTYSDYRQTNLNIYLEWLGQRSLDLRRHFLDLAPALQLIFNSSTKLSLGYRFQISGNAERMTRNSWNLSLDHTFLGALRR